MTTKLSTISISPGKLEEATCFIKSKIDHIPDTAIVLGSGMAYFAEKINAANIIETKDIPHYPTPTVAGHKGRLIFGEILGTPILAAQGRTHYYEGVSLQTVTFAVQLFHNLGVKNIILTNAAGGVNDHFHPGDFILIKNIMSFTQIKITGDMLPVQPFSKRLQSYVKEVAEEIGYTLRSGVYCWTTGPSFESNAEVEAVKSVGGDLVGMSTVPEVVVAHELGMEILGISLVTNLAAGIGDTELTHEEVQEVADKIREPYYQFMSRIIKKIGTNEQ